MDKFVNYILRSRFNAVCVTALFSLMPVLAWLVIPTAQLNHNITVTGPYLLIASAVSFFAWIATVIMALVTLRHGPKQGLLLLPIIMIPTLIVYYMSGSLSVLISNGALNYALIWVLASLLYYTVSWGTMIEIACMLGAVAILAIHVFYPELNNVWLGVMQHSLQQMDTLDPVSYENYQRMIPVLAQYMTGLKALMYFFNALVSLLTARWMQARVCNPGGLRQEMGMVSVSWVSVVACMAILVFARGYPFVMEAMILAIWPLVFMGLSIAHAFARTTSRPLWLLVPLYIVFSFLPQLVTILLAITAIFEMLFHFRDERVSQDSNLTTEK